MRTRKRTFAKLAILIFFAITIPAIIQNAVYYVQAESNVRQELQSKRELSIVNKADKLDMIMNDALSLTSLYRKNETVYRYISNRYSSDYEFLVLYQDRWMDMFKSDSLFSYQISRIMLYTTNNTIIPGAYIQQLKEGEFGELNDQPIYLNVYPVVTGTTGKDVCLRICETGSNPTKILGNIDVSFMCNMNYYREYPEFQSYMTFSLDIQRFRQIMSESDLFDNMFITDDSGKIIANAKDTKQIRQGLFWNPEEEPEDQMIIDMQIGKYPLYLHGVYNDDPILEGFSSSRRIELLITLASVIITLTVIYLAVFSVNKRMYTIVEQSEINQIELEKETNRAKLLALQSQVNPHFMFNALESIRLKAIVKDETETADMIKHMAKMFRHMIVWDDKLISLREEIAVINDFLSLQKYRFEDEFSYELDISEEAWSCLVPRMIFQPLVENASIHGMETSAGDRWIKFSAEVKNESLMVVVEDSGGGMSAERLEELRRNMSSERMENATGCIGLANVYRRLRLYYGTDFTFDIDSEPGKGTQVTIRIPEAR